MLPGSQPLNTGRCHVGCGCWIEALRRQNSRGVSRFASVYGSLGLARRCALVKAGRAQRGMGAPGTNWLGKSVERVEDAALLTGRGRYIDDLGVRPGTHHAAILRSPHGHAIIRTIRTEAARRAPGVAAVVTGAELKLLCASLGVGI